MAKGNDEKNVENIRGRGYTHIKTFIKYGPEVLISAATNRPVKEGACNVKQQPFWCEVCKIKLTHPIFAIGHFSGFQHMTKAKKTSQRTETFKRKQTNNAPSNMEPAAKHGKHINTNRGNHRGGYSNRGGGGGGGYNQNNYSNTSFQPFSSPFGSPYQGAAFGGNQAYGGQQGNTYQGNNVGYPYGNQQVGRGGYAGLPRGHPLQSRGSFWRN